MNLIFARAHRLRPLPGLLLGLVLLACSSNSSSAPPAPNTWRIAPDGSGAKPTIQEAIDAAAEGDTILLAPGTYRGPGNRDLELRGKAIAIVGEEGPERTILDPQGKEGEPHRAFHFHEGEKEGTLVRGITITGGYVEGPFPACYGGAILCHHSSPTIEDCRMIGNRSGHFGGAMVCFEDASPVLRRIHFIANEAVNNGGAFGSKMRCHPKLSEVLFIENRAARGGAFWCWNAGATIDRATFYGNESVYMASALWTNQAEVTIARSIVAFSKKPYPLDCTDNPASLTMVDCDVYANEGGDEIPDCTIARGIFSQDPLFCDPATGNFGLKPESPCAPGRAPEGVESTGPIGAVEGCADPFGQVLRVVER